MDATRNSYDELPYKTIPVPEASPARLSLASFLHGGPRPPVEEFRALELGCGNGRNLLPLAFYHPRAEFVGVDNSESAIALARAGAAAVGTGNVRFEIADLSRPGPLLAESFDYVILHGVFSWVEEEVRNGILEVCSSCLSPDGVVYLSHNVKAGWRVRSLVRDMLMYAVGGIPSVRERVLRAKELAKALAGTLEGSDHAQHVQLAFELDRVPGLEDSYLYHEYLLPVNLPFHHREVVAMTSARGLDYVCDAQHRAAAGREPEALGQSLDRLGYQGAEREEYIDFLGCRTFRSSIYARSGRVGTPEPDRGVDEVEAMFIGGNLEPEAGPSAIAEATEENFVNAAGSSVLVTGPLLKAALAVLAESWPAPRQVGALLRDSIARLAREGGEVPASEAALREIRRDLVHLHGQGMLEVFPAELSGLGADGTGRPHALALYEVEFGKLLTTPLHTSIRLTEEDRELVRRLGAGDPVEDEAATARCRANLTTWGLQDPATPE